MSRRAGVPAPRVARRATAGFRGRFHDSISAARSRSASRLACAPCPAACSAQLRAARAEERRSWNDNATDADPTSPTAATRKPASERRRVTRRPCSPPRTVTISSGRPSSRRSCATWTSTVRMQPATCRRGPAASPATAPVLRSRRGMRSWNSFEVNVTGTTATVAYGAMSSPTTTSDYQHVERGASKAPRLLRSTAFIRAEASRSENGFSEVIRRRRARAPPRGPAPRRAVEHHDRSHRDAPNPATAGTRHDAGRPR